MTYRIEYENDGKQFCSFARNSKHLVQQLKVIRDYAVKDIQKLYKSGSHDSVLDKYEKYIGKVR